MRAKLGISFASTAIGRASPPFPLLQTLQWADVELSERLANHWGPLKPLQWYWGVSRVSLLGPHLKPFEHHSTMVMIGLREVLYRSPIMPILYFFSLWFEPMNRDSKPPSQLSWLKCTQVDWSVRLSYPFGHTAAYSSNAIK